MPAAKRALGQLRNAYADWLEQHPGVELGEFCRTVATGRQHHQERVAIAFTSREEAIAKLRGESNEQQTNVKSTPRLGWLFADESQANRALLKELATEHAVVQEFLQQCSERLKKHTDGKISIEQIEGQTPAFVLQACQCKLWQAWGVEPDVCFGSGVGQYTAACMAGCLCFFDALVLVYEADQVRTEELSDEALSQFELLADQFNFYPPHLPLWCSIENEIVPTHRSLGGRYWRQHLESDIGPGFIAAVTEGDYEVGFVIGGLNQQNAEQIEKAGKTVIQTSTITPTSIALNENVGKLYLNGCDLNFDAVFGDSSAAPLSLPTYPFQRKRYWITEIAQFMKQEDLLEVESTLS